MGKRGRGKPRGGSGSASHSSRNNDRDARGNWALSSSEQNNDNFNTYYKAQSILPDDDEWNTFMKACQAPLPTTFRITASRAASKAVNQHVEQVFVPMLSNVSFGGVKQNPPRVLQWYPDHLAWQLDTAKQVIRKSPEFAKFQQFLVHETDSGNISRQEAVSMIPPLLLAVEPHHYVLDCCAAPGSKTGQLLEALHARTLSPSVSDPSSSSDSDPNHSTTMPSGLLIANDSDAKRCHMLVHQSLNRIGSPNTMITNLDASTIPTLKIHNEQNGSVKNLLFDRILCDVPCSGDGTMRKNPGIWKTWKTADGLGLHGLQLRILTRAIQMLKPGGRLVYSTCSFNPIEDEAVVSAALDQNPKLSLVDVSNQLQGLDRRPGMTDWKVFNRDMVQLDSFADSVVPEPESASNKSNNNSNKGKKVKGPASTCWPNGREKENHLERCLRLYPHLQDTGGFFVAVLEKAEKPARSSTTKTDAQTEVSAKSASIPAEGTNGASAETSTSTKRAASPSLAEEQDPSKRPKIENEAPTTDVSNAPTPMEEEDAPEASTSASNGITVVKATEGAGKPFNEEPYSFLADDDDQIDICQDFFQLDSSFPRPNLFVRNTEAKPLRSIYLTSPAIRDIIQKNDYGKMRLVSCGVRIFARQDSGNSDTYRCKWRILQDGLSVMSAYMGKRRKVSCTLGDLKALLLDQYPAIEKFGKGFQEQVRDLENGSAICEIQPGEEAGGRLESSIILPLWRAPISLCLMVEKMEKRALSLRVFGEDLTLNSAAPLKKNKPQGNKNNNKNKQKGEQKNGAAASGQAAATSSKPEEDAQGNAAEDETVEQEVEAVEEEAHEKEEDKTAGAEDAEMDEMTGEV